MQNKTKKEEEQEEEEESERQVTHYNLEKRVNEHATLFMLYGQRSRAQEYFLLSHSNTPKTSASMTVTLEDPYLLVNEGPK